MAGYHNTRKPDLIDIEEEARDRLRGLTREAALPPPALIQFVKDAYCRRLAAQHGSDVFAHAFHPSLGCMPDPVPRTSYRRRRGGSDSQEQQT